MPVSAHAQHYVKVTFFRVAMQIGRNNRNSVDGGYVKDAVGLWSIAPDDQNLERLFNE